MFLRPVAAAVLSLGVLASGHAVAGEDDTPLSLTLAQYLSRDNNLFKDDQNKAAETVSTSVAQVGFNKAYGRQTYRAAAKLSAQRYKNFDQFNNDGKDVSGSFTTEFLRDWLISANGLYNESLNSIQNNAVRFDPNIRKYRDGGFSVQYGNGGTWAVAGSYDSNKQTYSQDSQKYQNANQSSKGLKVIYFASDALNYSLGTRRVVTDYPLNGSYSQVVDRNVDLSTNWQVTGLSSLNATLTRRSTSYTPSDIAGNSGWTGSASWGYTPHGIISYNVGFARTTGTDRSRSDKPIYLQGEDGQKTFDILSNRVNNNTVTTSINAAARMQVTGKIAFGLNQAISHFKIDRTQSQILLLGSDTPSPDRASQFSSYYHATTLSMEYAAMRSLSLSCSYMRYSQNQDIYRLKYTGNSVDCNANFTID
ncbi:hypothetical protein [Aquabacterium sp. NJ1]|uniref:hypothetical protein n=1 Tax=Aquabacterium sp. NJ1 TaxID=1538295 RepID=UPI00126A11D9|nr:hypothetical protein [Aquabacterium sp. NJ1]